jgi:hypothetical protein
VRASKPHDGVTAIELFEIQTGVGLRSGLVIQISEGQEANVHGAASLYISDDAYSFIEPILARRAPSYGPGARWGVTEIKAVSWHLAIVDLRVLAGRVLAGQALEDQDLDWIHLVDLDEGLEIDAASFRKRFDDPVQAAALGEFLVSVAQWIEQALERNDVLTVYGV